MRVVCRSILLVCCCWGILGCGDSKPSKQELTAVAQVQRSGAHVAQLGGWYKIDYTHMGISEGGLEPLQHVKHLRELILAGTSVTDDDLQYLSDLPSLRNISLKNTKIGDEGLKHLSGLPGLIEIDLEETQITDEGLVHLSEVSSLKKVWLRDAPKITIKGVKKLKKALPKLDIHGFE